MKKLVLVSILMAVIVPLFAQGADSDARYNTSNMYYVNVPVEKIFMSGPGYVIQYRRATNQIGTIGIPYNWFTDAGARAELINLPRGRNWPSLTVFYRDGEFSHVRLYVHRTKSHITWGVVPQGADVSRHFPEDPESFEFKF